MNESIVYAALTQGSPDLSVPVYAVIADEGAPAKRVVYQVITEVPENNLAGEPYGLSNYRIQIDCYALNYKEAAELYRQCVRLLEPVAYLRSRNPVEPFELDTKLFRISADFSFWLER